MIIKATPLAKNNWTLQNMDFRNHVPTNTGWNCHAILWTFHEKYPTIETLAQADDAELLKLWEGLGYYSRARNLKIAAQEVVEKYDGKFPDNLADILSLKGVGPYTAAAIASISFGLAEPAIDGNLMRVTSRVLN